MLKPNDLILDSQSVQYDLRSRKNECQLVVRWLLTWAGYIVSFHALLVDVAFWLRVTWYIDGSDRRYSILPGQQEENWIFTKSWRIWKRYNCETPYPRQGLFCLNFCVHSWYGYGFVPGYRTWGWYLLHVVDKSCSLVVLKQWPWHSW